MDTSRAMLPPAARPVRPPDAPETDSLRAWGIAASAFFASSVVFGVIYSFGIFLKPMAADFDANAAAASAFFAITSACFYLLGAPAGRLSDRYGPRPIVMAGALILGAGLCLTALVDNLWLAYLTYAIGAGVGGACCYVPTLSVIGGWFVSRRNTALGIAAAGTGGGTLAFPPLAAVLIEHHGWRASYAVLGLAGAAILLACAVVVRPPPGTRTAGRPAPRLRALLRSRDFLMLYLSWTFATTALFVPFVFLPAYARDHGAGELAAAALVSVIGGMSIVGRLLLGPMADRVGVVPLFKATVLVMGISYSVWLLSDYTWLVVFAAVLGISYGSRIAAVPAVLIEFFGLENLGATLGLFFTATGISAVLGPMLAGLAVELAGYSGGILFALAAGLLGFAVILPLQGRPPQTPQTCEPP